MRGYIPPQNVEETIFVKQSLNLMQKTENRGEVTYSLFLDLRQKQLFSAQAGKFTALDIYYEYGYAGDGERCMAVISRKLKSSEKADIPIVVLYCKIQDDTITHRDFLGALMGLKIKREYIGDIIIKDNYVYIIAHKNISLIITQELKSIKKCFVNFDVFYDKLEYIKDYNNIKKSTVASLRIDAVTTAVLNISRGESLRIIKQGDVRVNHLQISQADFEIFDSDILSIKGYGKFKIFCGGEKSKKDRTFIKFMKF